MAELLTSLASLGPPEELSIVYEGGPCGYGLVREPRARGYVCEVIAPSKMPSRSGDRVKTDLVCVCAAITAHGPSGHLRIGKVHSRAIGLDEIPIRDHGIWLQSRDVDETST